MKRETIAFFILRCAIASVFIYASIASFLSPDNWVEFFPLFLQNAVPEHILIPIFSSYEIVLAAWLLWGKYTFYAAVLAAATISGIIIFNLNVLDVVFRDFAIILSAVSLAVFTYKKNNFTLAFFGDSCILTFMKKMIEISNSISLPAFLSVPDKEKSYPAIILIHEIWGLDNHIKDVANRYAKKGSYAVIAPDLFAGTPIENAVSHDLFAQMHNPAKRDEAQKKMRAALAPMQSPDFANDMIHKLQMCFTYLEKQTFCNGTIGVLGFCFGGSYSFALAAAQQKIKAAVSFYGQAPAEDKIEKINCPVLSFYGEQDTNLVDNLEKLKSTMKKYKKDFTSYVYPDTGHAFFNDTNSQRYNKNAADDAWKKSLAFLSKNLK